MTDSKMLSDEITDSGMTITAIAKKIGITREGFYKKLNNETEFKASEISALQKILRYCFQVPGYCLLQGSIHG
mgnify:CR=1 FL=1